MSSNEQFPFKAALNTSTIAPFKLNVMDQIRTAADAGYEGIELWVRDIQSYVAQGGSSADIKQLSVARNIEIVNAIAFFKWADADEDIRSQALEQARVEIQLLADIGCRAVAAPPFGNVENVPLELMASQFGKLAEIGRSLGVEPYLEFWGKAKKLSRLSEAAYVAMESGVTGVKLLLDPFHMYTGGSSIEGISCLNGAGIGIVHVNDYPAEPSREIVTDAMRVFPGEGVGATTRLAELLAAAGYRGYLSLELFIPDYGTKTALEVAGAGLDKVRQAYSIENAAK